VSSNENNPKNPKLSPLQERIRILNNDGTVFEIKGIFKIKGVFDLSLWEEARKKIIEKYDVLKSPSIHRSSESVKDAGSLNLNCIVQRNGDTLTCILTANALVCDNISFKIIIHKLVEYYNNGNFTEVGEEVLFQQYANWQQNLIDFPEYEAVQFWNSKLSMNFRNMLPFIGSTPTIGRFQPLNIRSVLKDSELKLLREVCLSLGCNIKAVLLATLKVFIHLHSGEERILSGITDNGREFDELTHAVGLFSKAIPLDIIITEHATLADLISEISAKEKELEMWKDYFFTNLGKSAFSNKQEYVFNIGFDYSEWISEYTLKNGAKLITEEIDSNTDQNIIRLACHEYESRVDLVLSFDDEIYSKVATGNFADQFKTLLFNLVNNPTKKINDIRLFEHNVPEISKTDTIKKTVLDCFAEKAQQFPDTIALIDEERTVTYRELDTYTNQLAAYLYANDVKKEDVVGILLPRSVETVTSILAVLKTGAAFLPIDPEYPKERIRNIVEMSGCKTLICLNSQSDLIQEFNFNGVHKIDHPDIIRAIGNFPKQSLTVTVVPEDLAYVIYTSGSTGKPKGCEIIHEGLYNYIMWANEFYFSNHAEGNFPLFTSTGFDLTITSIFLPLVRGKSITVYPQSLDVAVALEKIFENSLIDTVKLTPAHIQILDHLKLKKTNVKTIITGGEALTKKHATIVDLIDPNIRLYNEYGPTESTVGCIAKQIFVNDKVILIGKPIANTEIFILRNGSLCPPGVLGEIVISGLGLARGYRSNEEGTQIKFKREDSLGERRLYFTGDFGRQCLSGEFEFVGRKDDQVKIMSHRIELQEIVIVLESHENVKRAVVTTRELNNGEKTLIAFVILTEGTELEKIKKFTEEILPAYMVPAYIMQVHAIPLTINGKIDYTLLPEPFHKRIDGTRPTTNVQLLLAEIWEELLEIKSVCIEENFFELGGTSLKAIKLISSISKQMNVKLELRQVFSAPVLCDMALLIENKERTEYKRIPIAVKKDHYELSHSQKRLWVLSQLEEGSVFYNMPRSYVLKGKLDCSAIEKAFLALIERHETIRTAFVTIGAEMRQRIEPTDKVRFTLELTDLSSDNNKEQTARDISDKEAETPFDLASGLLLRARLLKMQDECHVLLVTIHHIISDGWSMDVVVNEVLTLYNAFSNGETNPLPHLPVQYKDYAEWHNHLLHAPDFGKHKQYWIDKLEDSLYDLDVPADYERPEIKTYKGGLINDELGITETLQLKKMCKKYDTTMFIGVFSMLKLFISKITSQNDFIIGTPVAGRDHQEIEGLVGFFVNMLASRSKVPVESDFSQFLRKVHEEAMEDLEHQIFPFDMLLESLKIKRNVNRSAIYNIGFNWDMQEKRKFPQVNLDIEVFNTDFDKAQADLWFFAREENNKIILSIEYNRDLFKKETIVVFMEKLKHLMKQCLDNPSIAIEKLNLRLSQEEELEKSVLKIDLSIFN
jgi:amino acid adenylation domain-containing protein